MFLIWQKFKLNDGVTDMLKKLIIPVFTKFFKEHFSVDVVVEEVPAVNPVFTVSIYNGNKKQHLLIIYINDRQGILPILNVYHYDGEGEIYLREMVKKAKRVDSHYTRIIKMFENIHEQLSLFKTTKLESEDNIFNLFTSDRVNRVNDFNKLSGTDIAKFTSVLGLTTIRHDCVFTIYNKELYLDLRLNCSVNFSDKLISSHPQLLENNPSYYNDLEKGLYNLSRSSIINRIRQNLKITLNPQEVLDEDIVRYVQLLEMNKI
jgi:hypothetical protein